MAILVSDDYTLPCGISIKDFIITLKGKLNYIDKIDSQYRVGYTIYYYEKNVYINNQNYSPILTRQESIVIADVNTNIYNSIYENIKSNFNTYSDI